jgi:hypothetical protein
MVFPAAFSQRFFVFVLDAHRPVLGGQFGRPLAHHRRTWASGVNTAKSRDRFTHHQTSGHASGLFPSRCLSLLLSSTEYD